jgi:hypothetical protein
MVVRGARVFIGNSIARRDRLVLDCRIDLLEERDIRIPRQIQCRCRSWKSKPRLRLVDRELQLRLLVERGFNEAREEREEAPLSRTRAGPIVERNEPGRGIGELVVALVGEDDRARFDLCGRNTGDCGHVLQLEFLRGSARASGHAGGDEDSGTVASHGVNAQFSRRQK